MGNNDDKSVMDWRDLFDRTTKTCSMGVHIINPDTMELLFSNEAGFRLINMEKCDYFGRKCYEVFFGTDKPCENCRLAQSRNGATQHELYMPDVDRSFMTNTEIVKWSDREVYIEYITDITNVKQAEMRQKHLLNQMENVIRKIPGAVCVYVYNGKTLMPVIISEKYSEMIGADAGESLKDGVMYQHVHPDDKEGIIAAVNDALHVTHYLDHTYRSLNEKTGKYIWINVQGNVVTESDGVVYAYVTYSDVSRLQKLRKTEIELVSAQMANEAKTEFFSRMSHDMRTPMNGILGLTELSMDETSLTVLKDNIKKIRNSGKYLLGLINDTLDFEKIESNNLVLNSDVVCVQNLVNDICSMIQESAKKKGVNFRLIFNNLDMEKYVRIDAMRTKQIILNLLSNSVKFTPSGGTVILEFNVLKRTEKFVHGVITVSDTGIGMSSEFLKNGLYKPFAQEIGTEASSLTGTGLGLSIVKRLVDLMGGTIEVESEQGSGTKFTITLDFDLVPNGEVVYNEKMNQIIQHDIFHRLNGKKILFAEDHPLNAEIAKKLLVKVGCDVTCAANGKECLDLFKAGLPGQYDAIIMDIRMPVMNGLTAASEIRRLEREDAKTIPIIAMTANAYTEDIQKSFDAGMNAHLTKPIEPNDMWETLARCIYGENS